MKRKCADFITSHLEYSAQAESPTSYHLWSAMSVLAAAVRRQVWVDMGFFRLYPNLYIVLVGPPAARKGTAMEIAMKLISDVSEVNVSADSITREALIRTIAESETTTATANGGVYVHSSVTIFSKELSVFLGTGNHDLLSLLTDLFDSGDRWEYKTKNKGIDTIHNLWVNLLAASTPSWLVNSVSGGTGQRSMSAISGGFTSRVIFVVEDGVRHHNAHPVLTPQESRLKGYLKSDLELISQTYGEFKMPFTTREFYKSWYETRYDTSIKDPRFEGYAARKHVHLIKIAMLCAISAGRTDKIELTDMQRALKMLDDLEYKMAEAFGAAGRSDMTEDIDLILNTVKIMNEIKSADLKRAVRRDVTFKHFDQIMAELISMKFVGTKIDPTDGSAIYFYKGE